MVGARAGSFLWFWLEGLSLSKGLTGQGGSLREGGGELLGGSRGGGCLNTEASKWADFSSGECLSGQTHIYFNNPHATEKDADYRIRSADNSNQLNLLITSERVLLTGLHPWNSWSVCTEVAWRVKAGLLAAAPPLGHDPPRTKQKWGWSRVTESGCGGGAAAAGRQEWASADERTAWPVVRVSARSAFRRPAVSPPAHNGCTPPGRNHRGPGTGQKWTCLETRREQPNCNTIKTTARCRTPDPEVPLHVLHG